MAGELLIYGANGYTGQLISRLAASRGERPILAGRSGAGVRALANELGLQHRVFGLDDPARLQAGLQGIDAVLHCAGPFSATAIPMVEACLATRAHYLDITGEIAVFQAIWERDARARAAGITLLPGVGFDVVPTDCLAAHLARRLPGATHLTLAFTSRGAAGISRGTATSAVEGLGRPGLVRRGGALTEVAHGSARREIDFGFATRRAIRISWGDVFTAFHTTGIPNIEVYATLPGAASRWAGALRLAAPLLWSRMGQAILRAGLRRMPPGPTDQQRAASQSVIWGEARDADGHVVRARLVGPDGYTMTSRTALAAACRVLTVSAPTGFQTPAQAFGADWILECEGTSREDLAESA
jgi:short subunit dehydrogenase-like uncharacterized protein